MQHRVIHAPKDDLDIIVVVPCYDEGINVLDTIYSAAIQMCRDNTRIGIFLVINNAKTTEENKKVSNKKTASLIIDIIRGRNLETYSKQKQRKIQRIQTSGLHIGFVDIFSEKGSPEICNVGYARDMGTRAILPYLRNDDSVICHTDADCKLLKGYFGSIKQHFLHPFPVPGKEKIHIATGGREFKRDPRIKNNFYEQASHFEETIHNFIVTEHIRTYSKINERIYYTPGSHIIFRKGLFKSIKGFPHIGGAEDVAIGIQSRQKGFSVAYIPANISTLARISTRTDRGHGFGFDVERKSNVTNISDIMTESIESLKVKYSATFILFSAHKLFSEEKEKWINFITSSFKEIIPEIQESDILKLATIYFSNIGGLNSAQYDDVGSMIPPLFAELNMMMERYFPLQKLEEVMQQVSIQTGKYIEKSTGVSISNNGALPVGVQLSLSEKFAEIDVDTELLKKYETTIKEIFQKLISEGIGESLAFEGYISQITELFKKIYAASELYKQKLLVYICDKHHILPLDVIQKILELCSQTAYNDHITELYELMEWINIDFNIPMCLFGQWIDFQIWDYIPNNEQLI